MDYFIFVCVYVARSASNWSNLSEYLSLNIPIAKNVLKNRRFLFLFTNLSLNGMKNLGKKLYVRSNSNV